MAGLILARRALSAPKTYRKPLRPRLDGTDPINQGQVTFYVCGESQNSPLFDISGARQNALPNGGPIVPALGSVGGNAPYLQGSGQSYTNPGNPLTSTNGFTFYCRFWDASAGFTNPRILSVNENTVVLTQFTGSNRICFSNDGGGHVVDTAYTPQAWNDLVCTCDGSGNAFLYLNGVQVASGNVAATVSTGGSIGFGDRNNHPGDRVWPGKFDCIRMWNRVITAREIARLSAWPWAGSNGNDLSYLIGATATGNVALAGVSATAAAGSFSASVSSALTGVAATAAAGSAQSGDSAGMTGVSASCAVGGFVGQGLIGLTGANATAAAGSLSVQVGVPFSGVSATAQTGTLAAASGGNVPLTGVAASGQAGSFVASIAAGFTGVSASCAAGAFVPSVAVGLAGVSASAAAGSPSGADALGFTGVSANGLAGSLSASIAVSFSGVSATALVGTLAAASGGNIPLTGVSTIAQAGNFGAALSGGFTGAAASAAAGSFTAANLEAPLGVAASASAGNLGDYLARVAGGVAAVASVGTFGVSTGESVGLIGVSCTVIVGGFRVTGPRHLVFDPRGAIVGRDRCSVIVGANRNAVIVGRDRKAVIVGR